MMEGRTITVTITRNTILIRNFIYFVILMANFLYLFVLYVLSSASVQNNPPKDSVFGLQEIFYLVMIAIAIGLILNQMIFIPKAQKIEEPYNRFGLHFVSIMLGVDGPSVYGLVLGFISLQEPNGINWLYVGIPIAWSFIYGFYFYLFHYQPTLSEMEVGKQITRTRKR